MKKKIYNPYVCELCKSYRRMFKSSRSNYLWIVCENCGECFRYRDIREIKSGNDRKRWRIIMRKRYYGIDEAAMKLGIEVKTLYDWVRKGYVPYRYLNDILLFDDEDIEIIKFYMSLRPKRRWLDGYKKRILQFIKKRRGKILQGKGVIGNEEKGNQQQ